MVTWIGVWALIWWDSLILPLKKNNKFKASSEIRRVNKSMLNWTVFFSGSCCLTPLESLAFSGQVATNAFNFLLVWLDGWFFLFWFGGILFGFLFSWFLCTTVQRIGFSLKATSWSGTRVKKQCFLLTAEQEEEREEKRRTAPVPSAQQQKASAEGTQKCFARWTVE